MKRLIDTIKLARSGDEMAMIEIINKFDNLLNKYARSFNSEQDGRSELELKLIQLAKVEINFDKLRKDDDATLVKYIASAIRNHYSLISKRNHGVLDHEVACDFDSFLNQSGDIPQQTNSIEDCIIINTMKSLLTEREFLCVQFIVFEKWTSEKIAQRLGISKQAVNQCKLRGFRKLRDFFQSQ